MQLNTDIIPSALLLSILIFGCTSKSENADKGNINKSIADTPKTLDIPEVSDSFADLVTVTDRVSTIKNNHYFITYPKHINELSTMTYCAETIDENGAVFELSYVDAGGFGMDGYPNGGIGGFKKGGTWYTGDSDLTGMPVLLSELNDSMTIQWQVSQENALDDDDKWMASINMIFDGGKADSDPVREDRDYDLVIESSSHNFNNSTEDITEGDKRNYFARNANGSLRPFSIVVDDITYNYAVRYKFFYNRGDSNNKVHVKYIPIDENSVPPYINHSVKSFIDNSKEFIQYANMPDKERALANEKVAKPTLYLKSMRAGYEVYRGKSTLRNDFFKIVF